MTLSPGAIFLPSMMLGPSRLVTRASTSSFPRLELTGLGYEVGALGHGAWNGVALLSRVGLDDITAGLTRDVTWDGVAEARAVGAQLTVAVGTGRRLREALTRARGAIQNQQFD